MRRIALSGDGNTLLRGCTYVQVLNGPGFSESARLHGGDMDGLAINHDGTQVIAQNGGNAIAWSLDSGGWAGGQDLGYFESPVGGHPHVAISRDGKIAAIGNLADFTIGRGPAFPPYSYGAENSGTGGVAVYERKTSGWRLRRVVKPDSTYPGWAGYAVALGDNGRLLVVGAPIDPGAATGIDGDRDDDSAPERGAVWIY